MRFLRERLSLGPILNDQVHSQKSKKTRGVKVKKKGVSPSMNYQYPCLIGLVDEDLGHYDSLRGPGRGRKGGSKDGSLHGYVCRKGLVWTDSTTPLDEGPLEDSLLDLC